MIPLPLTKTEIHEAVSHCQEVAISFCKSTKKVKRALIPKTLRIELSKKIGSKCPTCDRIITVSNPPSVKQYQPIASSFTVEHLFPLALGGDNTYTHLMVAMCHHCNARRNKVMQQYIGSRRRTPKALEDVKKFVEWSITSVLLTNYDQDTEIQEIWEATESLKLEKTNRKKKRMSPPNIAELLDRISVLEGRLEQLENTKWRRLTRFITGLLKRKPRITQYSAEEILLECIEFGGTTPVKLGQKLTEHQTIHGWDETGKGAFNERFGISKQQTYTTTIIKILGGRVRVTGSGNDARYSIVPLDSESPSEDITENPEINFTPEDFSKALLRQKERVPTTNFSSLYGSLIKENETFNLKQYGIKPNDYLIDKCSNLLTIIERPDGNVPPTVHYWIDEVVISGDTERRFPPSNIKKGISGFSTMHKSIRLPRDPEHLLILIRNFSRPNPDSLSYRDLLTESRSTLGTATPNGSDVRLWKILQNMRGQGPEDTVHESYSNSSPEEIISALHQYIDLVMIPNSQHEVNSTLVDSYFQSVGSTYKI
tara:strand:- start:95 stop:1717 length:1623 start_codon:yes stop_codon:yes gene_type:complete